MSKPNRSPGPPAIDGIGPTASIDEYWKESDETRRKRISLGRMNLLEGH